MSDEAVELRPGRAADAAALAAIHLRSRAASMPWLPVLHDDESVRSWMAHVVLAGQHVLVAERAGRPVAFAAPGGDWLEQLYVEPEAMGTGVGRRLLDAVRADRPAGFSLRVFARNAQARRFYEGAGLVPVEERDGSGNEEGEPERVHRWEGAASAAGRGTT